MNSRRVRMVTERSRAGEIFGFAMLGFVAIVWPALMLMEIL